MPRKGQRFGGRKREYDHRVTISVTRDDLAAIDAAASEVGLTRSQWIRSELLRAAKWQTDPQIRRGLPPAPPAPTEPIE